MGGIDRRLVAEVVTLHGIPIAQASSIVRYILAEVVADLRRCQTALADPDLIMGVRIAATRIEWGEDRVRMRSPCLPGP